MYKIAYKISVAYIIPVYKRIFLFIIYITFDLQTFNEKRHSNQCLFSSNYDIIIQTHTNPEVTAMKEKKINNIVSASENIYKTIVENIGEEIFVCDGKGIVLFANPASLEVNHVTEEEIIGKNVKELVKKGIFSESSTIRAIKERKPVSIVQNLSSGRRALATGNPVFDENGEISIVISTSKDVDAVNQLINTINTQDAQIESLREEIFSASGLLTYEKSSQELKEKIKRVAPLNMPLLIKGDVGVEKNQAAKTIHTLSPRRSFPFINLNSFILHHAALEIKLFGYEESSPTSGSTEVKKGMIELADGGTLLISDIEHLPGDIQRRLHGYLETNQFTRTYGSKMITADTRIIATTCSDLKKMSDEGSFMKELYYSLNTVPITIPPLSERSGDISIIARSHISKLNAKYKSNKMLDHKALGTLASYSWPGNTKELEQVLESAYILCDTTIISSNAIHTAIHGSREENEDIKIYCNDIIPLKDAKHELEKQLVLRAYETYKTTYKAAEALGVNQSTVSKILKKYRQND